jgi:NADPH:quinone reductase
MSAATMRACVVAGDATGTHDYQLKLVQIPPPIPSSGEVVIHVNYAGVNRADVLQCQGLYRAPVGTSEILGLEVSGTITALEEKVTGWAVGERVAALTNGGGYAEYVSVPQSQILRIPDALSLQDAACLPEALATAAMALVMEAKLQSGERVLLHGGASGIGMILIQVARCLGATVFATATTPEKKALIQRLGATPLSYDTEAFAASARLAMGGNGVDVIIDTLGGAYVEHHIRLLNPRGRMMSLAVLEGSNAVLPMGSVLMKNLHLIGATLRARSCEDKAVLMEYVRENLWKWVANGRIITQIDHIFPFVEAKKAHVRMENRLNCGKIVLEVS